MTDKASLSRAVRLATPDAIREGFSSNAWGEPHSGDFLTKALLKHHAPEKPAIGVVNAILLSFADYAATVPRIAAVATTMRIPQVVAIVVPDPTEAALVQAILDEFQG